MAIASGGVLGTGLNGASNSSYTFTTVTNTLAAGDFAILVSVSDNTSTVDGDNNEHTSVSGGTGTWTKLGEYTNSNGAAAAGVTVSMWLFEATGTMAVGTTITMNFASNRTDKCSSFWKFTKASGYKIRKDPDAATNPITSAVDAANDFGSSAFSGLPSQSRLYIRGVGKEANTTTDITASTNFTRINPQRSRNNAAAVIVRGEFRINTSTGETSNPTLAVSGDTAGLFFALEEYLPDLTAQLSSTDSNETITAVGNVPVGPGSLASTDSNETITAASTVNPAGQLAATEANDTLSGAATVEDAGHTGALAATDPGETLTGAGAVEASAGLAGTDPTEQATGVAAVPVSASGASTDSTETLSGTGSSGVTAGLSATEANETLSASASIVQDATATLAATDPVETASGSASIPVSGGASPTDPNETLSGAAAVLSPVTADLATTDPGETFTGAGSVTTLSGSLAATETVEQMMAAGSAAVDIDFSGSDPGESVAAFSRVTVEAASQTSEPPEELFAGVVTEDMEFTLSVLDELDTLTSLIQLSPINILEEMLGDASMTTTTLNLTTMLEAVNAILASVGESPVSTIDGQFVDAVIAQNLLIEEMRAVQTRGWDWNTDKNMTFNPDEAGYIRLPRNILRVVFDDKNIVARGLLLYDRANHTYIFEDPQTATSVVSLLPFEGMPESLRRFCMIRAGRRFQDRLQSDAILHEFQRHDELVAWAAAVNDEAEVTQSNFITNDSLVLRLKGNR